jgi:hypothetical protein
MVSRALAAKTAKVNVDCEYRGPGCNFYADFDIRAASFLSLLASQRQ